MNKSEIENEAEGWKSILREQLQNRREWYVEQRLRIADRQVQQVAIISSIAAAILAIIATFSSQQPSLWNNVSFYSLVINVVGGMILVYCLSHLDSRILGEDKDYEIGILQKLKKSVEEIVSNPTIANRNEHAHLANTIAQDIIDMPERYELQRKLLNYGYILFLVTFVIGIFAMVLVWQSKDISSSNCWNMHNFPKHNQFIRHKIR